ncbi:MAG: SDR family NAD(P)-dependent oxidoreductase [Chitinispirillaceae bacterium]|nr:SDR family NAD(P)-dependent oxidoreductase [Chitinispirillaceae bacterium]
MKKNRAILITGASKRLGLQMAIESLRMGYYVIIHYRSTKKEATEWIRLHPEYNKKLFFIKQELSLEPEKIIDRSMEFPCRLVGLVNNASIFSTGNLTNIKHLKEIININFFVPASLGTAFYKRLKKGWIINISDAGIKKPNEKWQNYRMSKFFLEELTRQQAFLFAPNVRVNAIAPGPILPVNTEEKKLFQKISNKIPIKNPISVDSFLKAYTFLVENSSCTGEILRVDGGWHLYV